MHVVILAGGSGTRFWPLSREARPKQVLKLFGGKSLIEQTVRRTAALARGGAQWIVTNAGQAGRIKPLVKGRRVFMLAEPCGRDTAAAIGWACAVIEKRDPSAVVAVMPADHLIRPQRRFEQAVRLGETIARERSCLVTLGVKPTYPATGYGYIRRGGALGRGVFKAAQFREKPDLKTAQKYLAAGGYFWNAGIFVGTVGAFLAEIGRQLPALHKALLKIQDAHGTARERAVLAREYAALGRVSIDYGVMERASNVCLIPVDFEWDDVGSWNALARWNKPDKADNVALGDLVAMDSGGCITYCEKGRVIAALGVKDLVIVQTADATLVCEKTKADQIKKIVDRLRYEGKVRLL